MLRVLEAGAAGLVVCLTRVTELARLPREKRSEVITFLRNVPTLIGQPEEVLEEDELACACAEAAGFPRRRPKSFARTTADWGYAVNAPGGTVADLLASEANLTASDGFRMIAGQHIQTAEKLRSDAVVAKDPLIRVRIEMERHLGQFRTRNPDYGAGLSASDLIKRSGGAASFPAFHVPASLLAFRLKSRTVGEPNDLLDEDTARYHAYSAVSIYDHRTKDRFWAANIPGKERATSELSHAMKVLQQVQDGTFEVEESYLPK